MGILKVVVNTTETERVLYTELPDNYRSFLDFLQDNIKSDSEFLLYWIDTENDKVEVNNENAFIMFCRLSTTKKIFVSDKKKSPLKQNVHFDNNLNAENKDKTNRGEKGNKNHSHNDEIPSKNVHYGVQCDNCDVLPIVGFRYKCLQCPDYDLCMTCESKFIHSSHKMIRIPDKLVRRGSFGWRFCNPLFENFQKGENKSSSESGSKCHSGEGHHHRRRRCHREGGRPGFMANFAQMMNDMAEGDKSKNNSTCNNGKNNDNTNSNNQDYFLDPELIKTGVEVLTNFGEMFSKMVDPFNITVEVDLDEPKNSSGTKTNLNNDSAQKNEKADVKDNTNNSANVSAEQKPKDNESFAEAHASSSASSISSIGTQKQINPEMEWTIIDDSIETNKNLNANILTKEIPTSSSIAPSSSIAQTEEPKISFSELNKVLENHVREEKVKENQEERNRKIKTDIVYHKEPHINNAIIAMIAMGFSNEGQWLTHLLESVNGDIPQALDLLKPVK